MYNEALELTGNPNVDVISVVVAPKVTLEFVSVQQGRKRYLLSEHMIIGEKVISSPVELQDVKVFMKRFVAFKLNSTHKNVNFEYNSQKNEKNDLERTLKVLGVKEEIRIAELKVDSILGIWHEYTQGYNKIKVYERYKVFSTNPKHEVYVNNEISARLVEKPFNTELINNIYKRHNLLR